MSSDVFCGSMVLSPHETFNKENASSTPRWMMSSSSSTVSTIETFHFMFTTPCYDITLNPSVAKTSLLPNEMKKITSNSSALLEEGIEIEHIDMKYSTLDVIFQKSSDSSSSGVIDIEEEQMNWDDVLYSDQLMVQHQRTRILFNCEGEDIRTCESEQVEGREDDEGNKLVEFNFQEAIGNDHELDHAIFTEPVVQNSHDDSQNSTNDRSSHQNETETNRRSRVEQMLFQLDATMNDDQRSLSTSSSFYKNDKLENPSKIENSDQETSPLSCYECKESETDQVTDLASISLSLQKFEKFFEGVGKQSLEEDEMGSDSESSTQPITIKQRRRLSPDVSLAPSFETSNRIDRLALNQRSGDTFTTFIQNYLVQQTMNPPDLSKLEWIPKLVLYLSSDKLSIVETALFELGQIGSVESIIDIDDELYVSNQIATAFNSGAHTSIIGSMAKWYDCQEVQMLSCRALHNFGLNQEFRDAAGKFGAFEAILQAMRNFPNYDELQRLGCACLCCLSANAESAKYLVLELNGLETISQVMQEYPCDDFLQVWCCSAINNMSNIQELKKSLHDASILEVLLIVFNNFSDYKNTDHALIQHQTREAIKSLI